MIHLLSLAVFGGCLLVLTLRVIGRFLAPRALHDVLLDISVAITSSLGVLIFSGALLFADGPLRYYANTAFRAKLLLLLTATTLGVATRRLAMREAGSPIVSPGLKAVSLFTVALWLCAGIAGRAVGVL
jgi:hypothetical protein